MVVITTLAFRLKADLSKLFLHDHLTLYECILKDFWKDFQEDYVADT